jgi:hypothetical protein
MIADPNVVWCCEGIVWIAGSHAEYLSPAHPDAIQSARACLAGDIFLQHFIEVYGLQIVNEAVEYRISLIRPSKCVHDVAAVSPPDGIASDGERPHTPAHKEGS